MLAAIDVTAKRHAIGIELSFGPLNRNGVLSTNVLMRKYNTEIEIDGSSRMLIAPELREFADLSRDVIMLGMGSCLELWDKRRYLDQEAQVTASPMPESIRNFIL